MVGTHKQVTLKCQNSFTTRTGRMGAQPNKPIMFTEYGTDTLAGLHTVTDELFTEEYQVRYCKLITK